MAKFKVGDKVTINDKYPFNDGRRGKVGEVRTFSDTHPATYRVDSGSFAYTVFLESELDLLVEEETKEETAVHTFKVGDRVIGTEKAFNHRIGDTGTVTYVHSSGRGAWVCSDSDETTNFFPSDELKLIEEEPREEPTMNRYPYTLTNDRISIFFEGKMHSISVGDVGFESLKKELKQTYHNRDVVADCLDKPAMITRITEGLVSVVGDEVLYNNEPIHGSVTQKMMAMLQDGFDIRPWAKFLDKVMKNPSFRSREALYNFLEHFETPITPDGNFLAFKRVRDNFMDIHSGTMDNSPGRIVSMDRTKVDDDSQRTCSHGLHACASNYLGSFYASTSGYKVVVVSINPKDVVAVPYDYKFSKMRVCEYVVLGEAEEAKIETISKSSYYDWDEEVEADFDLWYDEEGEPRLY